MDEPVSQAVDLAKGHLDDVPEPVSRFMGTVLGAAEIELSAMLGEQVRAWRFRRQIRIMQRAQQQLEEAGLEARSVPFRTLAPLLDGASFEEDNELTERWASMLAQAAVEPAAVPASFPRVLRELEPVDAQILFLVFDNIMRFAPGIAYDYRYCASIDCGGCRTLQGDPPIPRREFDTPWSLGSCWIGIAFGRSSTARYADGVRATVRKSMLASRTR
jgi:hypothetical protein